MNPNQINDILSQYLVTALWSSIGDDGEPLDEHHNVFDFADSFLVKSRQDIRDFVDKAGDLLDGMTNETIGHDFWLTRNHHGAGFWDRGLGEVGKRLTEIADSFPEIDLYIADNGDIDG